MSFFDNVPRKQLPQTSGIAGLSYLDKVSGMQVGSGSNVFRVDQSGLWLGGKTFADAPFSVNMLGQATFSIGAGVEYEEGYAPITIFKQDGIPTSEAAGDLWFDTNDKNRLYRAGAAGADEIAGGEWEEVRDTDIAQAISDASDAQDTADVKVKVFKQDAIPTSVTIGDLWVDTDDDNKLYRAASVGSDQIVAGEWEAVDDQRAADALTKSDTGQTLTGNVNVGDSKVLIDGANTRILINDGTNDRILIGYQSGGF